MKSKNIHFLIAGCIIIFSFPSTYSQVPSPKNSYLDYNQILSWLSARQAESQGFMKIFEVRDIEGYLILTPEKSTSIIAVEITKDADDKNDPNKPDIIITGCHHAREWPSVNMCLLLIEFLVKHRTNDRVLKEYDTKQYPFKLLAESGEELFDTKDITIKRLLENAEIIIVPVVNPDGYIYSRTQGSFICNGYELPNNLWRKNRRDTSGIPASLLTEEGEIGDIGVDLNRNYPFMWDPPINASIDPSDCMVYRGWFAGSEKEVEAMRQLHSQRWPLAAIDYHTYGGIVAYPWGYTTDPIPNNQRRLDPYNEIGDNYTFRNIASKMTELIGFVSGDLTYGTLQGGYIFIQSSTDPLYPTSGDATDWRYDTNGCAAFLIELWRAPLELPPGITFQQAIQILTERFQPDITTPIGVDGKTRMERMFNENLPAALFLMFWVVDRKFSQKPAIQITK